jgi:hypothetical protein
MKILIKPQTNNLFYYTDSIFVVLLEDKRWMKRLKLLAEGR